MRNVRAKSTAWQQGAVYMLYMHVCVRVCVWQLIMQLAEHLIYLNLNDKHN